MVWSVFLAGEAGVKVAEDFGGLVGAAAVPGVVYHY